MDASVIVVNWRQPELTTRCLASLEGQAPARRWEVVLVENEATPGSADAMRRAAPTATVVEASENLGFAGGVARGIAASTGDVVILLNNDAVAEPGFVEAGLAALDAAGPEVAAVAATVILAGTYRRSSRRDDDTLVAADGTLWARVSGAEGDLLLNGTGVELGRDGNGRDRDWLRASDGSSRTDHQEAPFGFSGGAAFLRRSALEDVGGFDPALFMYYEDLDVAWRLRLAGYEVIHEPTARTVHRHASSSSSSGLLVRYQSMRNRLLVTLRNGSRGLVARVVLRTVARLLLDLTRPGASHLPPRAWGRLLAEAPRLAVGALRARSRSGIAEAARRELEARLLT